VREAICRHGAQETLNTDHGCQFIRAEFTGLLMAHGISMDGKGCWRDKVFVERLRRGVKYEEVDLKAYDGLPEAKTQLGEYSSSTAHDGRAGHLTARQRMRSTSPAM